MNYHQESSLANALNRIDTLEAYLEGLVDDPTTLNNLQRNTNSIRAILTRYFDTSGQQ